MPLPLTVAAFDFDHTLLKGDSMRAFLRFYLGELTFAKGMVQLSPQISSFFLGKLPRKEIKEIVLSHFLGGIPAQELFDAGERFAQKILPSMQRPEAMSRLRWHQAEGHTCLLVTASMDIWTRGWAQQNQLNLIATESMIDPSGLYLGKIKGVNNWGPGKRTNVERFLKDASVDKFYAYGDSRGDKELLEMADFPYYRTFSDTQK